METWILLTTILATAVNGYVDQWNLVHFGKSKDELKRCLENTNLPSVLEEISGNYIISVALKTFQGHTESVDYIDGTANLLANFLKNSRITFEEDQIERIKEAIINALHECSDYKVPNNQIKPRLFEPPRFLQEIPEVAELLNMILVGRIWILPFPSKSQYTRFQMFSERSLTLIEIALRKMNNAHKLLIVLTQMWNRRVVLFYDARNIPSYLSHTYSSNRTWVLTPPESIVRLRYDDKAVRDPPVPNDTFAFEITRYRALDWNNPMDSRIFSFPRTTSMTRSQHRFESGRHEFIQGLFAYLESVERGLTDESSPDDWEHFFEELPLADPWEDHGYGAYLEAVQRRELSQEFARNSPIFSSLVRSLEPGDQIDEFDLLMMFWHRLRSVDFATTTTKYLAYEHQPSEDFVAGPSKSKASTVFTNSTTTTTASSIVDSSSTPTYDKPEKGKGPVTKLHSGKYVPQKQPACGENNDNNSPSSSGASESYQKSKDVAENNCKFGVNPDNSELPPLSEINKMVSLELLQEIFSAVAKSQMHLEGGLSCYQSSF